MESSPIDVLIVGAGPTGLLLATELRKNGLAPRIVDTAPELTTLSKAIVIHARTLEIFESLGIVEPFLGAGKKIDGVRAYASGKVLVSASFDELETRYPFALAVPQSDTEALLAKELSKLGGNVERNVTFTALTHNQSSVRSTLRHRDGREETVESHWLVGCDGAHSGVRHATGLEFEGASYPDVFMLADVKLDWPLEDHCIHTFFSDHGILACFPMPNGRYRLIATCPAGETATQSKEEPSLADVQSILDERCHAPSHACDPRWLARFHIHARQVGRYGVGRVFLAGDAAHIHSPVGGQGMNTGLQDAHNLAWKLSMVEQGKAPHSLLDSYGSERHSVGANLLRGTDWATRAATLKHPVARAVRNRVAGFLSHLEVVQQRMVKTVAELDLGYRDSALSVEHQGPLADARLGPKEAAETANFTSMREFARAPRSGDRAPDGYVIDAATKKDVRLYDLLDSRSFSLLLFDGRAATSAGYEKLDEIAHRILARYGGRVHIHIVVPRDERPAELSWNGSLLLDPEGDLEHRYGGSAECLYLLRPDGYVGYRSQPANREGLEAYLKDVLVEDKPGSRPPPRPSS